jgi:hypothetical protein
MRHHDVSLPPSAAALVEPVPHFGHHPDVDLLGLPLIFEGGIVVVFRAASYEWFCIATTEGTTSEESSQVELSGSLKSIKGSLRNGLLGATG